MKQQTQEAPTKNKIKVVRIQSTKQIPVQMKIRESHSNILSVESAENWAAKQKVITVYWLEKTKMVYGYPGE